MEILSLSLIAARDNSLLKIAPLLSRDSKMAETCPGTLPGMDVSSVNLALPTAGTAPEWVHLVPAGTFKGKDGRGPYTLRDPQGVIAHSMQFGAIPFDENHATETASIVGGAAPARGWVDRMEMRDDGIWGHVDWTDTGKALMTEKSYRWLSPVLLLDPKDGKTIIAVTSVALTNNPNLIFDLKAMQAALTAAERKKIKPKLFAVPEKEELSIEDTDHVKLAWDMVDRTEGLTDSERAEARRRIRARAKELGVDTSGWAAQTSEGQMEKKAICTALGLPESTDDAALLVALQTSRTDLQTAKADVARLTGEVETLKTTHVPLAKVTEMQTQIDTMLADGKRAKAVAFVDAAIKEGKPIVPQRDNYIALHVANPEQTEAMVNGLPSLHAAGPGGTFKVKNDADPTDPVEAMSAEQRAVCAKMGLDPKEYVAHVKKMEGGTR